MRTPFSLFLANLTVACSVISLCGCGGGGGGGDEFIGAAEASISASPQRIDSGDRALVRCDVGNVHPEGIMLKFRYPVGLKYVPASSYLSVDNQVSALTPAVNKEGGNFIYLVFFFSQTQFGQDNFGSVSFELEGASEVKDGRIAVDADVEDPEIDNANEFSPRNPEFEPEDDVKIEVVG